MFLMTGNVRANKWIANEGGILGEYEAIYRGNRKWNGRKRLSRYPRWLTIIQQKERKKHVLSLFDKRHFIFQVRRIKWMIFLYPFNQCMCVWDKPQLFINGTINFFPKNTKTSKILYIFNISISHIMMICILNELPEFFIIILFYALAIFWRSSFVILRDINFVNIEEVTGKWKNNNRIKFYVTDYK